MHGNPCCTLLGSLGLTEFQVLGVQVTVSSRSYASDSSPYPQITFPSPLLAVSKYLGAVPHHQDHSVTCRPSQG